MKGIAIQTFGGRERLQLMDLPKPEPGKGEVLVQIKAAGVNPVDWKIREGFLKDAMPHAFPLILGWDAAGIVTQVGEGVGRFHGGEEVYAYCRKPLIQGGSYAEWIVLPEENVAEKPKILPYEQAASVPLAALTAYQSLFEAADLKSEETVLIHAAAGGVGGFAVQLAKDRGARVIGTASPHSHQYVRDLGADDIIDYTKGNWVEALHAIYPSGVDLVYYCIGGSVLRESLSVIKSNGRIVTIVEFQQAEEMKVAGHPVQSVFVEPNSHQLEVLTEMIDAGRLKTYVSAILSLEEAAKAHEMIESQRTRGKIVLTI